MARTALPIVNPVSINAAIGATAADVVFTTLDTANGNSIPHTGREMLLIKGGAAPQTVTFTSVADDLGRTMNITAYTVGISLFSLFGPFPVRGWRQADGNLYLDCNSATLSAIVMRIPTTI